MAWPRSNLIRPKTYIELVPAAGSRLQQIEPSRALGAGRAEGRSLDAGAPQPGMAPPSLPLPPLPMAVCALHARVCAPPHRRAAVERFANPAAERPTSHGEAGTRARARGPSSPSGWLLLV